MIYFDIDDILSQVREDNLDFILEGDEDKLNDSELDAVGVVQSYLSHDYDVEQIFQTIDTPDFTFHPTIKRMTIDIMMYNLHTSRVIARNIPESVVNRRDDAISWLKDVANPKTMTNAPFLPKKVFEERKNNAFSWGSQPKASHKY